MAQQILLVNNQASAFFRQANYKSASMLLSDAITLLEKESEAETSYLDNDAIQNEEYLSDHGISFGPSSASADIQNNNQSSYTAFTHMMEFVFHQGLTIRSLDSCNISNLVEQDHGLLYAILLYNYALCLHLHGISIESQQCLQDALASYEMAMGLLRLKDPDSEVIHLELAILNNYGHIMQHWFDARRSEDCLRRMHSILAIVTNHWASRVPQEMSCFTQNIIFNGCQFARPAAAA